MLTFMDSIRNKDLSTYIESIASCFAAPTIEGLKAGTLVHIRRPNEDVLSVWLDNKKRLLTQWGVNAFLLYPRLTDRGQTHDRILLLIYRKKLLEAALFRQDSLELLAPLGYNCLSRNVSDYLEHLQERMEEEFPHEIGLFLDYPPEDVEGFMRDGGENSLYTGYWKVYGDVQSAQKTFQIYRQAEYAAAWRIVHQDAVA